MENKFRINGLLDCYENLLTEKQKNICSYYYREDLSLQEISEIEGVTRSAVYDTIKRCRKELETYEEKLHMYESMQKRMKLYEEIMSICDDSVKVLINQCIDTENEQEENYE